ncbi:Sensory transduction histidine kinase [unidentified eubacterium SCB49]|nr:Sensory transduction histidine kinase [unidentified eubacterium SCB49]
MLRYLISILLFFIFLSSTQAQENTYSKIKPNNETSIKKQLASIDSIISLSFNTNDSLFVEKSLEYIELAKENNYLNEAARKAIKLQNVLTYAVNDPRKAVSVIDRVLSHKYKIKDSFLVGALYSSRGKAYYPLNLKSAIKDYTNSIKNYNTTDHYHLGDSYLNRGQAYSALGKFTLANEDYQKAYGLFEDIENYQYMLYALQGIISMYSIHGFYEQAKVERDKYFSKSKELGLDSNFSYSYYNQAMDYEKQGKYKLEFEQLLKAAAALEKNNSKLIFVSVNSKLSAFYARDGDFDNAEKHLDVISDNQKTLLDQYPVNRLIYENAKATYFNKLEQPKQALVHATTSLNLATALGREEDKRDSYLQIAEIQASLGNYKEAMISQKAYVASKDSIFNERNAFTLAHYQTLYETEKNEKELVKRNNEIVLLENENSSFKKQMIFIAFFVIVSFVVILLIRTQKHLHNNKILQENFSQELIVSQEKERIRISKDLHDGLGQQLLLIKNKLVKSEDDGVKHMVENAIDEIRTISRDLHPFQLQELGITKAIENALTNIDENTGLFISSEIDNIDNMFNKEQEANIYRIVQESLTNVIKHAKAEAIKVSVLKLSKLIVITIKDNGVGFDYNEKYQNLKSLGLKTLLERVKSLDGKMKVQSVIKNGTLLEFQIPIK